ncbi:MAG: ABC transporter substrate-binding protein [Acidobacteria bacterium]|nr:ABC transporter substrate-binding protein [Acidobacteriota bacterium]
MERDTSRHGGNKGWAHWSRRRLMVTTASAFVVLAASGMSAAGASSRSHLTSHATKLTKVTVTLALDPPKMIFMGFWVAQQEGFFARNGLDVTLMPEQGGVQAARAVAAGDAYFEAGGTDAIAAAYAQAHNLEAIWSYGGDDLSLVADKSIASVAALKGKTMGAGDATGPAFELSEIALRNAHVNTKDVKIAVLNGRPALVGAMAAGAIQASVFHVDDGYTLLSKDHNVHIIASMAKVAPQYWYGAVGIPVSYGQKHRSTVVAFLTSMIEAQRWMYTHRTQTIDLSVKYTGETPAVVAKSYDYLTANKLWTTGVGMTDSQVSYTLNQYKDNGIIPTVPKATDIFNQTFVKAALAKVGG